MGLFGVSGGSLDCFCCCRNISRLDLEAMVGFQKMEFDGYSIQGVLVLLMTFRRRVKSPEVAETTFTMSTIEEEMEGVGAINKFAIIIIVNRYDQSSKN